MMTDPTLTSRLVERLLELPALLEAAERDVLLAEERKLQAAETLTRAEDELLLDPERLTGKNAEIRAAQVRRETERERDMLRCAELGGAESKVVLRRLTNELSCVKAITRLLSGDQ